MNNYYKLSKHLQIKLNEDRIDEGIKDFLNKMFGGFGFIGGLLSGKDKKDKMSEAMATIMQSEAEAEKKRMEKELEAEENLEIAKMQAEAEANKKRLDTVTQRKVDALNAKKRKLDNLKKNIEKGKLLPTAEQTAALIDEINNTDKDLTLDEDHPVRQLKDAAMMIMVKPDGSVRDPQEINDLMTKNESDLSDEEKELKKNIAEYNKLAEKHKKPILDGMESPAFKEDYMKSIFETARVGEEFKDKDAKFKKEEDEYKEKCEAQQTFKEFSDKHKAAKKTHEEADGKVNELKDKNPFVKDNFNGDKVNPMSINDNKFQDAIKSVVGEAVTAGKSEDDIKAELVKLGIPEGTAKKLASKTVTHNEKGEVISKNDNYGSVLFDDIDENELNEAAKNVAVKQTSELQSAISAAETAKSELEKNPDPNTPKGMQEIMDNPDNANKKASLEKYKAIPEEDRTSNKYDPSSDPAGKAEAKRMESERKKLDDQIKENENQQATRKQQRERAENRIAGRKENTLPDGINKDEIETALDGLEAGEIKKDGKIGIMVGKEFIEKPKPGSDKEDEYIAKREKLVLQMDVDAKSDIKTVKPDTENEGKYVIVKVDKDGNETEEKGVDKEKATEAIIAKRQASLQNALVLKQKQDLKDKIGEVLKKDGTIDKKKFDELSDAQKASITEIINDPEALELYFDGTGEDLKDIKDNLEKNADKYSNAMEKNDIDDNDWDETGDENEDKKEYEGDEDEEIDDEEHGKAGEEKVVKINGKWYKESEVTDGEPNENATEVNADEVTKDKKTQKKKLQNPKLIWKQRKKKNGDGFTKSYWNKDKTQSISEKEFKAKVAAYEKARQKAASSSAIDYTTLTRWLFEKLQ